MVINIFINHKSIKVLEYLSYRIGKLRSACQLRLTKNKFAVHVHIFLFNGIRPVKKKPATREHVKKARKQNSK